MVYLLHFDRPFNRAQHYIGFCKGDPKRRLKVHLAGRGSKLMRSVAKLGIGVRIARIWPDGDLSFEYQLKKARAHRRLCPLCASAH